MIKVNMASDACIKELMSKGMDVLMNKELIIKTSDPDIYLITDILKKHKIEINGINWEEPTLDEVFLKLTGEEVTA